MVIIYICFRTYKVGCHCKAVINIVDGQLNVKDFNEGHEGHEPNKNEFELYPEVRLYTKYKENLSLVKLNNKV